jgi:hypothetical protein
MGRSGFATGGGCPATDGVGTTGGAGGATAGCGGATGGC